MGSEIEGKVVDEQASRVVVNLTDSSATAATLENQLNDWPIQDLEEVIVINEGSIVLKWTGD